MSAREINFDGIVGPTHNYAGLGIGNVASAAHAGAASNPREAALQGLRKMKALHDLGLLQAVLPPQERPDMAALCRLGFTGDDARVLDRAAREAPGLLAACASASAMWTANAATVTAAADGGDGRVHFTPANLGGQLHRALEAPATGALLRRLFADEACFRHHPPLPSTPALGDEGAANHSRLCPAHGEPGMALFVYGRDAAGGARARFPARQTLEASKAVARQHGLDPARVVFARQSPEAVDAGVFHNDVIAVANENVMLCHEQAFVDARAVRDALGRFFGERPWHWLEVPAARVSLDRAVSTYLFNSQLVTLPEGGMALIVPSECREDTAVWAMLDEIIEGDNPVRAVHVLDVRQSMHNGGGPACLRLRVVLSETARAAVGPEVFLSPALFERLSAWVERHYRDRLAPADLADPMLLAESRAALDELTAILKTGSIYPFQRSGERESEPHE